MGYRPRLQVPYLHVVQLETDTSSGQWVEDTTMRMYYHDSSRVSTTEVSDLLFDHFNAECTDDGERAVRIRLNLVLNNPEEIPTCDSLAVAMLDWVLEHFDVVNVD